MNDINSKHDKITGKLLDEYPWVKHILEKYLLHLIYLIVIKQDESS